MKGNGKYIFLIAVNEVVQYHSSLNIKFVLLGDHHININFILYFLKIIKIRAEKKKKVKENYICHKK